MKVLILALGTRGDIEPLLAIGGKLKLRNIDVVCGASAQFREIVEEGGIRFYPFTRKFLELLESDAATGFMGQKGNILKKTGSLIKMYHQFKPLQKELMSQQRDLIQTENPDRVIYNMKCLYPVLWGMANPGRSCMILPIPGTLHKITSYSPVWPGSKQGHLFNSLIYGIVQRTFSKQIRDYTRDYHADFPGLKLTAKAIREFILLKEKIRYTISPSLFSRPPYWPDNARIIGYHERPQTTRWKPDKRLLDFIDRYKKILFITFGSMVNPEPQEKTAVFISLLKKHRIPAIINIASGGLVMPESWPDNQYYTETIPYEWIFPKVYAVIHHGGSGTTHTALKYGCATLVIPHILDQFFWAFVVSNAGAGPKGLSIKKLNIKKLEPRLLDLMENEKYRLNAGRIAEKMKREDFTTELDELI